ncbi:MAG: site-2 protease family protein [Magnetococcales bacterium]|nr:site-2 protease family protein [Magnetococcales bacterium]
MKTLTLLLTGLKLNQILLSGGSMLLSVFTYALLYGWGYGVGFVGLLLLHETGHFLAARQQGLNVGLPTFLPFVGAWIELKEQPRDAQTEAWIGLAGPLLGTIAALACYYLARLTDSSLLLACSYSGFVLNLFNLIPLHPFDGGRITAVLSPRLWLIGFPLLLGIFIVHANPLLLFMALISFPQVVKAWRYNPDAPENQVYYAASLGVRLEYAFYYLALILFLALMCQNVHEMLPASRR